MNLNKGVGILKFNFALKYISTLQIVNILIMAKKLFNIDSETKKMLQSISSTYLVPSEVVNKVWEYTIFTIALKMASNDGVMDKITIPYIGSLYLKENGKEVDKNGVAQPNIESEIVLSDSFKEIFRNIKQNNYDILSDYFDENYIKKVIEQYKYS